MTSQAAFGRALGIQSQPTYLRYERGRVPNRDVLNQIASALGVTVDSLLDDTATPSNLTALTGSSVSAKSPQDLSTEELEHALGRYVTLLRSEEKPMRRSILVALKQIIEALLHRER
jgi:transcriptional regulator with XRE-family HTH domain